MKSLYIPLAVLTIILAFSLLSGRYVDKCTQRWTYQLTQAAQAADVDQWDQAQTFLEQAQAGWLQNQAFFHTIMDHEDLDCTESLLAGTFAACGQQDGVEFHILLAQLITELHFLSEAQSTSIKNIL